MAKLDYHRMVHPSGIHWVLQGRQAWAIMKRIKLQIGVAII